MRMTRPRGRFLKFQPKLIPLTDELSREDERDPMRGRKKRKKWGSNRAEERIKRRPVTGARLNGNAQKRSILYQERAPGRREKRSNKVEGEYDQV